MYPSLSFLFSCSVCLSLSCFCLCPSLSLSPSLFFTVSVPLSSSLYLLHAHMYISVYIRSSFINTPQQSALGQTFFKTLEGATQSKVMNPPNLPMRRVREQARSAKQNCNVSQFGVCLGRCGTSERCFTHSNQWDRRQLGS